MMLCNLLVVTWMPLGLGTLSSTATGTSADEYQIDSKHSTLIFRVKHLDVSYFYGRFNEVKGDITFDKANPKSLALNIEIPTDSIDTNDKRRDDHLKGPDFFHAKQYKTMTFKSTKVKQGKDDTYRLTGDLTLRGVTKSITVNLKLVGSGTGPRGRQRVGFKTAFTFKRSDYGMDYMVGGLSDEIWIIVSLEGAREKSGG